MAKQLIECVPNFSEGHDMNIIKQITDVVESVEGVVLLDVDPGATTNRTVVTFAGEPKPVIDAAFLAIKKAAELIDMSKHHGEHPRMGATDVCPLVPIANISMEETVKYAHELGKRVGEELDLPIYFYEEAATKPEWKNLATVRSGEYEALPDKLGKPEWKPDFGPNEWNDKVAQTGATAISARNFLVAYNFNLNTTSTRRANAIAFDVREAGRIKKVNGKKVLDEKGNPVREPGTLKATKAIGWFIEEYGIAQISMNLTNIAITSVHKAFDEVDAKARARGIRVTGSELVGLIPLQAMLDAGKHYLYKQQRSTGIPDEEIIKIAIKSMGLDELKPFNPREKIIEYVLEDKQAQAKKLVDLTVSDFTKTTASEAPAPGGGSISAAMGAFGSALATMVANLSSHKRGWDDRWKEFSDWADKGKHYYDELLYLIDEDTEAFNRIMAAFQLPKNSEEEKATRHQAIQDATRYAIEIPFKVMQTIYQSMEVIKAMADIGNPNSVTDAGVGALAARSGIKGAFLNVRINAGDLDDKAWVEKLLAEASEIEKKAEALEAEILAIVEAKL